MTFRFLRKLQEKTKFYKNSLMTTKWRSYNAWGSPILSKEKSEGIKGNKQIAKNYVDGSKACVRNAVVVFVVAKRKKWIILKLEESSNDSLKNKFKGNKHSFLKALSKERLIMKKFRSMNSRISSTSNLK